MSLRDYLAAQEQARADDARCAFCGGVGNLKYQPVGLDHQACDGKLHGKITLDRVHGVTTRNGRRVPACLPCRTFIELKQHLDRGSRGDNPPTTTIHRIIRCPDCEPLTEGEQAATKLERERYQLPPVEDA